MSKQVAKIRFFILMIIILPLIAVLLVWWSLREGLQAKTTETRMREVVIMLQNHPGACDLPCLHDLARSYDRLESLRDAWGTELEIELAFEGIELRYRVRSLGKDRKRGYCCKRWVTSLEEDAVLENNTWLQAWRY